MPKLIESLNFFGPSLTVALDVWYAEWGGWSFTKSRSSRTQASLWSARPSLWQCCHSPGRFWIVFFCKVWWTVRCSEEFRWRNGFGLALRYWISENKHNANVRCVRLRVRDSASSIASVTTSGAEISNYAKVVHYSDICRWTCVGVFYPRRTTARVFDPFS